MKISNYNQPEREFVTSELTQWTRATEDKPSAY